MNGIVINLDPIAFSIGDFAIRWYGITAVSGILLAFFVTLHESAWRGLDEDKIYNLGLWAVAAGMVGARLMHVIDHWAFYSANPWMIPAIREGGLSIYGGLAAGIIVGGIYARHAKLPFLTSLDAAAIGLILGQSVGRIGNIFNGDVEGGVTNLPWGFIYTNPNALAAQPGVPTHPYPVYEIILNLMIFGVLWKLRSRTTKVPGVLFLVYAALYSIVRFLLMFLRDEVIVIWGLQQAQVLALATFLAAVAGIAYLLLQRNRQVVATSEPQA